MEEVEDMTFREYLYRLRAYRLKRVDEEYDMHLTAFLNVRAGAQKKKGKETVPVYPTMKEFFDYDKRIAKIEGGGVDKLNEKHNRMAQIAAQVNSE